MPLIVWWGYWINFCNFQKVGHFQGWDLKTTFYCLGFFLLNLSQLQETRVYYCEVLKLLRSVKCVYLNISFTVEYWNKTTFYCYFYLLTVLSVNIQYICTWCFQHFFHLLHILLTNQVGSNYFFHENKIWYAY